MIKLLSSQDLDKKKWDALVSQYTAPSQFFHFSWYLDAVCPKWQGLVYGDYELIFPITPKLKFGYSIFVQAIFTREFNFIGKLPSAEALAQINNELHSFRLLYFASSCPFDSLHLKSSNRNYQLIKLGIPYDEVYKNYSQNIKRSLKKAIEATIEIRMDFDPMALIELFRNEKGAEFSHLGKKEYAAILQLMNNGKKAEFAYQISAYLEGELIASSFYFVSPTAILFLKGAVNDTGKSIGAMVYLHDHMLKTFSVSHNYFDFGGSNTKGLREFNLKFGAIDMNYLLLSYNKLPWPLKSLFDKKYKNNA